MSGLYDSGTKSMRERCASIAESSLSVLILADAIALVFNGWHSMFSTPRPSSRSHIQYRLEPASRTTFTSSSKPLMKSVIAASSFSRRLPLTSSSPYSSRTVTTE